MGESDVSEWGGNGGSQSLVLLGDPSIRLKPYAVAWGAAKVEKKSSVVSLKNRRPGNLLPGKQKSVCPGRVLQREEGGIRENGIQRVREPFKIRNQNTDS